MKRRIILIIFVLAAVGAGAYYALRGQPGEIVLTGIVTTDDVIVSSQVQGRLEELRVDQGNIVKRGDLLARIQPDQWRADMTYYEQSERSAATQVSQGEADVRFEEAQTKNQIAQAEANLAAAAAQVTQTEADLENARLTFTREQDAFRTGAETAQGFDQARTAYDAQKAKLDTTQKQQDAAAAAVNLAKAGLEQVAMHREMLEVEKHQMAAAEAQKEKARVQLGYTDITAPIDGIVDVRAAMQGEVVNPGQAIVTLINPDKLWVRVDVEEGYVDRIHLHDVMKVRLPSGTTRDGEVIYRGVDADYATQRDVSRSKRDIKTFEIRLRCDNSDRALAVGMTAYVTMPLQAANSAAGPATSASR